MTLPLSGSISLSAVNTELGNTSTAAITLNDANVRKLAGKESGAIGLNDLHGATAIRTNATNLNLFTAAGSPSTAGTYRFVVLPGITIGATAGNTAITVGQFPTGSTIIIDNYGSIQGYGGASNSGVGGDAINANYANQTVTINNKSGAYVYAGGGGGGAGGAGGTGGQGYYTYSYGCTAYAASPGWVYYAYTSQCGCDYYFSGGYCVGTCVFGGYYSYYCYNCAYPSTCTGTAYTSGGAGGAGGAGGVGQGYSQSATSGSAGSGGSAGGTNAGTGGTGGTGGAGGAWGTNGSTGNTGATGASGNYTGGSAGSAGSAGGTAGRYLVKGSNSVTFNNSGTVAGGTA